MRVDLGIMAGAESKKFLVELGTIVDRLERVARALRSPEEIEAADKSDDADDTDSEEEEIKPKRGRPAKTKPKFEEEDDADSDDSEDAEEEEDDIPVKASKKKAGKSAAFEDDDSEDDAEEEDEKPAPKKGRAKKVTLDNVNDACMERAEQTSRKEVLALLQKNFDIEKSVTELEESDYADVVKLLQAAPTPKGKK